MMTETSSAFMHCLALQKDRYETMETRPAPGCPAPGDPLLGGVAVTGLPVLFYGSRHYRLDVVPGVPGHLSRTARCRNQETSARLAKGCRCKKDNSHRPIRGSGATFPGPMSGNPNEQSCRPVSNIHRHLIRKAVICCHRGATMGACRQLGIGLISEDALKGLCRCQRRRALPLLLGQGLQLQHRL
jgi:hypothetical protein